MNTHEPLPVTIDDVRAAAQRVVGRVHRTPGLTSRTLDEATGSRVFCKAENLQRTGAFKVRGAFNATRPSLRRNRSTAWWRTPPGTMPRLSRLPPGSSGCRPPC